MNRLEQKYGRNYTCEEVADFLRIDVKTARRKCSKMNDSFKIGRRILVPEKAFEKYLESKGRIKNDSKLSKTKKDKFDSIYDEVLRQNGITK